MATTKADGAFLTIGEVSTELGVPQHVLRYWESRFPQLKPLTRAGNRRYYRPADVALARRIRTLLTQEGYTVRGVQQLLGRTGEPAAPPPTEPQSTLVSPDALGEVRAIRALLADAWLQADGAG